jgi:thiamine biosynthesis lipoprotein
MQYTDSFRAMNTDIDVIVDAGASPLDTFASVRVLFAQQEERFSRFRPNSLLSRLNRGEAVDDPLFVRACQLALDAYEFTSGLFNPMVLPALQDAGYTDSFEHITGGAPQSQHVPDPRSCISIKGNVARLSAGSVDLGGIVKGWTVDLAFDLLEDRYSSMLVNAGGDLRCSGAEDGRDGWLVAIEGLAENTVAWQGTLRGALATSTTRKRRWKIDSAAEAHHIIDPRTGLPAATPLSQVSVWAPETWRAECWAKAVVTGGERTALRACREGFVVLSVPSDGPRWYGRHAWVDGASNGE